MNPVTEAAGLQEGAAEAELEEVAELEEEEAPAVTVTVTGTQFSRGAAWARPRTERRRAAAIILLRLFESEVKGWIFVARTVLVRVYIPPSRASRLELRVSTDRHDPAIDF